MLLDDDRLKPQSGLLRERVELEILAYLAARGRADLEDVRAVAYPVLRHRIMTTFHADADGVTPDDIIKKLIEAVPAQVEAKKKD